MLVRRDDAPEGSCGRPCGWRLYSSLLLFMITWKRLFELVCTPMNFEAAFYEARRGKKDHPSCILFCQDLYNNLEKLRQDVYFGRWKPWGYNTFLKFDGNKIRQIDYDPEFSDNVVQHAIARILLPLFKKTAIRDTYSGIKGRGLHDGVMRVHDAVKSYGLKGPYILKLDIHHFYQNVDIPKLKQMLRRKIKDKPFLGLIYIILDSHPNGLPIGNYLSQHLANFFLSELDHFMKEKAKCKHYFRYCDDIVILEHTKQAAKDDLFILEKQLIKLNLTVKPNKQIYHISRPGHLDFLGYIFYRKTIRIRKSIERDFRRAALSYKACPNAEDAKSLMSYYGWLRWTTAGYKLWNSLLPVVSEVKYLLPKNITDLKDATDLSDLIYNDGTDFIRISDVLNNDIVVVAAKFVIGQKQRESLRLVFFYPDGKGPYRLFTQSKVMLLIFHDIISNRGSDVPFEPFKTRIIESNGCYTLAPTETI